ncbi:MAG: NYN domain-containing protein [Proteobacteria bacterium]|nr:NYN domain-containing protein [Pseudomonadota bacterium]
MGNKAIVYIDGFNWYHAIFKHHPEWKWLNIQTFFEVLRPHETVVSIKFFSAIVDGHRKGASDARDRHEKYIKALKSLPKVKVILGKFQDREVTCRAVCGRKYLVPEEKKTDVNNAVEIMADAVDDKCDLAILISGDSDVQPPVQWVRRRYPQKSVLVYIPALPQERDDRRLDYYTSIGVQCKFLPLESLVRHQLPETIRLPDGETICRPSIWSRSG